MFYNLRHDIVRAKKGKEPEFCKHSGEELRQFVDQYDDSMLDLISRRHQSACCVGASMIPDFVKKPHTTPIPTPTGGYLHWIVALPHPDHRQNKPTQMTAEAAHNLCYSAQMLQRLPWEDSDNRFDYVLTSDFSNLRRSKRDQGLANKVAGLFVAAQRRYMAFDLMSPCNGLFPPGWHKMYPHQVAYERDLEKRLDAPVVPKVPDQTRPS